ncbi:MAG: helix-turn-helix transcriptional regulator [Beijerinckiaceae bacterium]
MRRSDIRQIYRLIDACVQSGGDPTSWRSVLAYGIRDIFGCMYAHAGEFAHIHDDSRARVLHMVATPWPRPEQHEAFVRYQVEGAHLHDPLRCAIVKKPKRFIVASIGNLVDPESFFGSEFYVEYMQPADVGDQLICIFEIAGSAGERYNLHTCLRARNEPLFTESERRLMRLLTFELSGLVGARLADSCDPVAGLTPRLRQALELLLDGLGEAEAARRLGVASGTFHKYVVEIYAALGVKSRPALHARFARRGIGGADMNAGDPRWQRIRREGAPMTKPWRGGGYFLGQKTP